jgi:plastocyanin
MKKTIVVLTTLALAGSWQMAPAADVTGKVTLKGTPPPEIPITFTDQCGPLHPTSVTTRRYVVGKDNGLKDVFVYISKGCEGKTYPPPAEPVVLDQTQCLYQPYVMGMMVGQKLQIKNSDTFMHNVHASPLAADGAEAFNIPQNAGQSNDKTFTHPEVLVKFQCDVHNWMFAYIGVMSNPYFAVTDADGNFKIPNLPPGDYTLTAYHLKAHGKASTGVSQAIKVEGDKAVTANFTVEVPPPAP